ncbi:MAG: efflux RND transporter periplasmic adaptor subunit [Candidatus Aminicenantales bacterium]|jgi:multidrug efflux pump subunit AcrA (membrane-fusion protein)
MRKGKTTTCILAALALAAALSACRKAQSADPAALQPEAEPEPQVRDSGGWIEFPAGSVHARLFEGTAVDEKNLTFRFTAPAAVVARVKRSSGPGSSRLILFDTPELSGLYSSYIQSDIQLKTKKTNFERLKDLLAHGACTGKEVEDASAELRNLETTLAENEAKLHETGLDPDGLNAAAPGTVWLICDLPEAELNLIRRGQAYKLEFPSFPAESVSARIDGVAEVLNTQTRKIRLRLSLPDPAERIRPGMYAKVLFELPHRGLMVPKTAVFCANARFYVFVRHSDLIFERREVSLSTEVGDFIEIAGGIDTRDVIVDQHVELLKGLSLGL